MARQFSDLFKNRSATQEFLFSASDDGIDNSALTSPTDRDGTAGALLKTRFTDMLERQGLIDAIDTRMASASCLCALAVRIEAATPAGPHDEPTTDLKVETVRPIAALCRTHGGVWARIGRDRLALAAANLTAADGIALAHRLLGAYPETDRPPITIGVAAYPTLAYTRSQILENAEKALDHGGFFGPGTITAFDAVSLNISGDRHYQAGDISGAIDEFKKGLLLDPSDANLYNSLGVCYGVLKDYDQALTAFEAATRLAPEDVMAIYNKGLIRWLQGRREQALQCFLEADTRESNIFEVVFHIGQILADLGRTEEARPYLEAATQANRRSGVAFKGFGACLDKLGLTKEAIQAYKSAVKINPADAESLSILARLYTDRGESLDVAAVLCEQSVRLVPDNGLFRHRLGVIYLNRGRLDDALAEFEMAVTLGHDSQAQIEETQNRMMAVKAS